MLLGQHRAFWWELNYSTLLFYLSSSKARQIFLFCMSLTVGSLRCLRTLDVSGVSSKKGAVLHIDIWCVCVCVWTRAKCNPTHLWPLYESSCFLSAVRKLRVFSKPDQPTAKNQESVHGFKIDKQVGLKPTLGLGWVFLF